MRLYVVGIRLPLVPEYPSDGKASQGSYPRIKEISGSIGMTSEWSILELHIERSTLTHPRHNEVIRAPVAEDLWELMLQRITIDPSLSGCSTDRIDNNPYWYMQTIP